MAQVTDPEGGRVAQVTILRVPHPSFFCLDGGFDSEVSSLGAYGFFPAAGFAVVFKACSTGISLPSALM